MAFTQPSIQQTLVTDTTMAEQDTLAHMRRTSAQLERTPIQNVLDITELSELILDHLPIEDLVSAQYICQTIHSVILASPKLQEKLFLRSTSSSKRITWDFDSNIGLLVNENTAGYPTSPSWLSKTSLIIQPLLLNTFILSKRHEHFGICRIKPENRIVSISWPLDMHFVVNRDETFGLKDPAIRSSSSIAQYRLMFLTQPPATKVELGLAWTDEWCPSQRRPRPQSRFTITNSKGITLGDLLKEADRRKAELVYIVLPETVVVTPSTMKSVQAMLARNHGNKSVAAFDRSS